MGPFPSSFGNQYILVAVDYVSKWVKVIMTRMNDHRVVVKFLISDNVTHFCNRAFESLMRKYSITHKSSITYHPQTNGQVEVLIDKLSSSWRRQLDRIEKNGPPS